MEAQKRTEGMAISSMVLGILGLFLSLGRFTFYISFVPSLLGIIFSNIAKRKIRENECLVGKGFATSGLVCGIIGMVFFIISLTMAAVFLFQRASGGHYYY